MASPASLRCGVIVRDSDACLLMEFQLRLRVHFANQTAASMSELYGAGKLLILDRINEFH